MTDVWIDRSRLHPKANEALNQNLGSGESIQVIIVGASAVGDDFAITG